MKEAENLCHKVFGDLLPLIRVDNRRNIVRWLCWCYCGNLKIVDATKLKSGHTKSCGCYRKKIRKTHGEAEDRSEEYGIWAAMLRRCNAPAACGYEDYGGRGIKVCERWSSYENFLSDMGRKPSSDYSIERINNNSNYEPENCKWATRREQGRNKRSNVWIEYKGRRMVLTDWCNEINISSGVIPSWIKKGKSIEWIFDRILTSKKLKRNR